MDTEKGLLPRHAGASHEMRTLRRRAGVVGGRLPLAARIPCGPAAQAVGQASARDAPGRMLTAADPGARPVRGSTPDPPPV